MVEISEGRPPPRRTGVSEIVDDSRIEVDHNADLPRKYRQDEEPAPAPDVDVLRWNLLSSSRLEAAAVINSEYWGVSGVGW